MKDPLSFRNNKKHSNGLEWPVNLVLKSGLHSKCFIIKGIYKSHRIKLQKVLLHWNYALFLWVAKSFGKNLKQIFYCFSLENINFSIKCEKSDKRSFSVRTGKIHLCLYNLECTHNCMHRLIIRYDAVF